MKARGRLSRTGLVATVVVSSAINMARIENAPVWVSVLLVVLLMVAGAIFVLSPTE